MIDIKKRLQKFVTSKVRYNVAHDGELVDKERKKKIKPRQQVLKQTKKKEKKSKKKETKMRKKCNIPV